MTHQQPTPEQLAMAQRRGKAGDAVKLYILASEAKAIRETGPWQQH